MSSTTRAAAVDLFLRRAISPSFRFGCTRIPQTFGYRRCWWHALFILLFLRLWAPGSENLRNTSASKPGVEGAMARRNTVPTAEAGALDSIEQLWALAAVVIVDGRSLRVLAGRL